MKLEFSLQIFEKYLSVICHENPSCQCRIVFMRAVRILVLRNFANAPKNVTCEEMEGLLQVIDVSRSRATSRVVTVRIYVTMVTPSYSVWE